MGAIANVLELHALRLNTLTVTRPYVYAAIDSAGCHSQSNAPRRGILVPRRGSADHPHKASQDTKAGI